ncbi:MAG TPA: sortase [Candidatus Saccharimonadales bacterium]|nr:sortase [Candidatus Saccharimonadales bacterium]
MNPHPSRHEQYLLNLAAAGTSPADLARAWHAYYAQLSDADKLQVWQQYHQVVENPGATKLQPAAVPPPLEHLMAAAGTVPPSRTRRRLQSLAFGAVTSLVVTGIFLFGFFNEVVITPFIQPSTAAAETPIIVDQTAKVPVNEQKIIIPRINVEIPVDYSQTTTSERAIELALDKGIVHYPTTVKPGQAGNAAFFGHSSNNIFNPGKYKFAFVLLNKLIPKDVFYLTYEGKTYAYQVVSRRIVKPTEVGVLGPVEGYASTATLITCNPPGTSINRLVVVGQQISPDPAGNTAPVVPTAVAVPSEPADSDNLPGNGPSLWSRLWGSVL